MSNDDRILLNLVLNEATVSAVEGRVRNLVNRLNNTNISLNINGRNLDNIVTRLNDIQQRMQTINSTPVNINANLTSVQQQYRLETERMRVAQQLELSRQRTLQTDNQAISALAQQNRTLTVNNNVTHQIEQGAQNIGHNMNVAGGHARDFVDYLADGVRYIVVYRSLYEIMNQIGEAFSEMKNVDKELISVRKTTGMAENEIEKIRKASYGVATEYGRTASEYLGSVSEFARGGYKELSTELAKVSLLTQNVGDVSADSANKMLLSVDAAYKLNGNVTELTNVVNGLNNIANLNPTSMQKMADGMQVSASMAKVAGLEISDLVALIGTGTAVTQREGGEVARAIRTILMNVRQVKGTLEDGTIIDDDSIAKAEKALNGVGIATKEVVNGVRELRDPMDILDELSGKWHTLGSEAKSALTEGLANKRQADIFSAIIENYDTVKKMQGEYFNSANSAIKENELYLQGWEATQKRVSAKWTEFVANMADTALITGSLNALYGGLVALDTPIGRIATSIVLVNTALTVSGRLWQAIRARSVIADIISMGIAEGNLGTAIQLVTGHLGRQAAVWAASPMGMATIAVAGIAAIAVAIAQLTDSTQDLKKSYEDTKNQIQESESEITSLESKIQENIQAIEEMKAAGASDIAIKQYEAENEVLQAQLGIVKDINKSLTDKAAVDARKIFNNEGVISGYEKGFNKLTEGDFWGFAVEFSPLAGALSSLYEGDIGEAFFRWNSGASHLATIERLWLKTDEDADIQNNVDIAIDKVKQLKKELNKLNEDDFSDYDEYITKRNDILKQISEQEVELAQYIQEINGYKESFLNSSDPSIYEEEIKQIDKLTNSYMRLVLAEKPVEALSYLLGKSDNSKVSNQIKELLESGEMTAETLKKIIPEDGKFYTELIYFGLVPHKGLFSQPFSWESSLHGYSDRDEYIDLVALLEDIAKASEDEGGSDEDSPPALTSLEKATSSSKDISTLRDAYEELSDEGHITFSTISDIKESLGDNVSNWEEYEEKLRNAKIGSSEFNQIMSELVYVMLENRYGIEGLANATEDEIAAILRENDVLEANKNARNAIKKAQDKFAYGNMVGAKTTWNEVAALLLKKDITNEAKDAILRLAFSEERLAENPINTGADVEALEVLARAAGVAEEKITWLWKAYSLLKSDNISGATKGMATGVLNGFAKLVQNKVKQNEDKDLFSIEDNNSNKDTPKEYDLTEATINRINLRAKELEQQEETIKNEIDIADSSNDLAKKLEKENELLETQIQRRDALNTANKELESEVQKLKDGTTIDTDQWFDSQGNFTEAYYDFLNSIDSGSAQEEVEELAEKFSSLYEAIRENEDIIADLNNSMRDTNDNIEDTQIDIFESQIDDIEHAMDMTLNNNPDADVSEFYKQKQKVAHEYAEFLRALDPVKYKNKIRDLKTGWWDDQEKLDDIALKEFEKLREAEIKHLEVKYDKEQAIISALEQQYEKRREIRDKQAEIDAELASSKQLPEYMEDNSTLFNDSDYKKLSKELSNIDKEIVGLYDDYRREINNLAEDEWYKQEEITAQFERQLEVSMDKYELAEKELELTKKRLEYDNILKQRDTRILVAGRWINTADPDKVREATQEKARLEAERENLVLTQVEDAALRSMQTVSDSTNTLKLSIENIATMLDNLSEGELARFARTLDIKTMRQFREELGLQDYSTFTKNNGSSTLFAPKSEKPTIKTPDEWFASNLKPVRYIGIDENGKLITEVLPDGYDSTFEPPRSTMGDSLSHSFDFAKRVLQILPNPAAMMPKFTIPNLPNVQQNSTSNVSQYTFTGDIHIDNPIGDPNDLVYALASQVGQKFDVTKNMKQ